MKILSNLWRVHMRTNIDLPCCSACCLPWEFVSAPWTLIHIIWAYYPHETLVPMHILGQPQCANWRRDRRRVVALSSLASPAASISVGSSEDRTRSLSRNDPCRLHILVNFEQMKAKYNTHLWLGARPVCLALHVPCHSLTNLCLQGVSTPSGGALCEVVRF